MTDLFDRAAMQALGSRSTLRARSRSRFESGPALAGEPGPAEPVFIDGDPLAEGALDSAEPAPPAPFRRAEPPDATRRPAAAPPEREVFTAPSADRSGAVREPADARDGSPAAPILTPILTPPPIPIPTPPAGRGAADSPPERPVRAAPPAPISARGRTPALDRRGGSTESAGGGPPIASDAAPPAARSAAASIAPGRPDPSPARDGGQQRPTAASIASPSTPRAPRPPGPSPAPAPVHRDRGGDAAVGAGLSFAASAPEMTSLEGRIDDRRLAPAAPPGPPRSPSAGVEAGGPAPFEDPLGARARARMESRRADVDRPSPTQTAALPTPPPAAPPPIEITIGRLEIRAGAAPPPRPAKAFGPQLDLAAYRSRRDRGP